jgi:hypothetical protein
MRIPVSAILKVSGVIVSAAFTIVLASWTASQAAYTVEKAREL